MPDTARFDASDSRTGAALRVKIARIRSIGDARIMGQSSSRIVDIKNDFELVVRASKELEHLLETHFQAPSGKMVGLHEKIGAARTRSGEPLTENAVNG